MRKRAKRTVLVMASMILATVFANAETDTALLCYGTNVMRFTVQDGAWSAQSDFAHRDNSYDGIANTFNGLASDGRRVFVGEAATTSSRILEFDMDGVFKRRLVYIRQNVEYMCMSLDGNWLYATVNPWTTNAAVYRYDPVTSVGGVFIPNTGTNALGQVLWAFNTARGVAADSVGRLWVSERSNGTVYVFDGNDGTYLDKITGLSNVQGLHYSHADGKVYGTTTGNATFIIDVETLSYVSRSVTLGNRLGITQVQGVLCSGRFDSPYITGYDLDAYTTANLADVPVTSRHIITLPRTPLRKITGHLLIAETVSNRVAKVSVDEGCGLDPDGFFAGGEDVSYDGLALRQPRGLAVFSNAVYVAEGVAGGRVLRFSKWGTFKEVLVDFSKTDYTECVPAALACTHDGKTLYVTDAHTLFMAGNGVSWGGAPTNGYYNVNSFGETVYKIDVSSRAVSVFADSSSLPGNDMLLEPRGIAVDQYGNVYCPAWYNNTNSLYTTAGWIYKFNNSGVRQEKINCGNPSVCYYDPEGVYDPPAGDARISGSGIVFTGNGISDFWWVEAGSDMSVFPKLLDLGAWRTYLDVEVLNKRMVYTDPEYGTLWRRMGDTYGVAVLTGLFTPTYLAFAEETGPEPPPLGTFLSVQ